MSRPQKIILFALAIVVLTLLIFGFVSECKSPSLEVESPKIHGFNLVAPRDKFPLDSLKSIQSTGAEWVAVVPYAFCDPATGAVSYGDGRQWWGETPEGISTTIQMAHSIGLKVMLKPHLWVRGQGWAGDLSFESDALWQVWEKNYAAYIKTFTSIAREEGVELLCIGTEIRQSSKERSAYWETLITTIKSEFKGPLTYAANWDEYEDITFWTELDYIGVDAYFPILPDRTPEVNPLKVAWNLPKSKLQMVSEKFRKPILFTEYGYESTDYPTIGHWNVDKDSLSVNHEAQINAYEAMFQTFVSLDWWAGGFVWKWHLNLSGEGDGVSKSYTPQQKPALKVISKYYKSNQSE